MAVRYGIVSTSQIVPRFVEGIRASEAGVVSAISARCLDRAQKMADELDIPKAYGSYQELFEDQSIDIVYIAVYNKAHYSVAKKALLAKKHVLLEKPFTLEVKQAEELFELAQQNNCFLMEAQKALFLPITKKVKEVISEGKIGKINYLRTMTAYPSVDHIAWFKSLEAGGGALHGSGSYPLQYMQYVTGQDIKKIIGTSIMEPGETDSQCDISIVFEDNIQGHMFITTYFGSIGKITIFGENGRIEVSDFWRATKMSIVCGEEVEEIEIFHETEFVYEVNHVNRCLEKSLLRSPIMTKNLTIETIRLVEKMYQIWNNEK